MTRAGASHRRHVGGPHDHVALPRVHALVSSSFSIFFINLNIKIELKI